MKYSSIDVTASSVVNVNNPTVQDTDVNINGLTVITQPDCKYYNLAVFSWVSQTNLNTINITAGKVNIDVGFHVMCIVALAGAVLSVKVL